MTSSTSCSVHQAKRPYAGPHSQPHLQSTITAYFNTPPPAAAPSSTRYDPHPQLQLPLGAPQLPAAVQTSLLHVGMRIRKAVPEGYKTNSSSFTLFAEPSAPTPSPPQTHPADAPAELTPFSGFPRPPTALNLQQPGQTHNNTPPQATQHPFFNAPKAKRRLSTTISTSTTPPRRRSLRSDEPLSPKSRPLAHPRTRKMLLRAAAAAAAAGQENDDAMALDFEDAEFLDYRALGEEVEVVMGGF